MIIASLALSSGKSILYKHPLPFGIFGILTPLPLSHRNSIDDPWGSYGYFLEIHIPFICVMVRLFTWFKLYLPLFQTHYHTSPYSKTEENKIQTKDKIIEPQRIQS